MMTVNAMKLVIAQSPANLPMTAYVEKSALAANAGTGAPPNHFVLKANSAPEEPVYLGVGQIMTVQMQRYAKIRNVKIHASFLIHVAPTPSVGRQTTERSAYVQMAIKEIPTFFALLTNAGGMKIVKQTRNVDRMEPAGIHAWSKELVALMLSVGLWTGNPCAPAHLDISETV